MYRENPGNPMQPKVTIILPVYNVEEYLQQCLDSVVNQTLREIQIICVNDGSTDDSPAILEEYAAQDPRIEVYHQENQGGGSARNAAYPYIRGKYAYFADPDDWLELDLCQQCYEKAETTEADIVILRPIWHDPAFARYWQSFDPSLPEIRQSPEEKREDLTLTAPWLKFWRSKFLLSNEILFPAGKRPYNDMLPSWKGIVLANRIAVLDNPLYHHRSRSGSYQTTINDKHFVIIETLSEIEQMLLNTGFYELYKNYFGMQKIDSLCCLYCRLPRSLCIQFQKYIHQSLTESDREFYRTNPQKLLSMRHRLFYRMVEGNKIDSLKFHFFMLFHQPRQTFSQWMPKPLKEWLKAVLKMSKKK